MCLISFLAGALHERVTHPDIARADSNHTFELMIYHTLPGKAPALESVFQGVSALQTKHGLNVIGYWVPNGDDPAWKDTFVYLIDHASKETAESNWSALHGDPAFKPYFTAAAPLILQVDGDYKVDEIFMRPTGYSNLK